jgi:acyl carrier protein
MEQALHLTIPSVETDLFETGALDSLVFIDILMLLERDFGISIDMSVIELEDFKSVDSISAFINRHQSHNKMQA